MRGSLVLGLALIGALGCRPLDTGAVNPPDDIVAMAVVSDGVGSPIEPWSAGAPIPIVTRGAGPHFVYGFTAAQLAPLGEQWKQGALRVAQTCEAALPTPAWVGQIDGGGLFAAEAAPGLALTVDGLRDVCPDEAALPLLLDVRGESDRCESRVVRDGCQVDVLSECGAGNLSGWVHPDGGYCLERTRGDWVCEDGVVGPGAALSCNEGTSELGVVEARPGPAPFEIETLSLGPGAPYDPRLWALSRQLYPGDINEGYVHGMVAVGGRLLVAHTTGTEGGDCWSEQDQPSFFSVIDPDTAAVIERVPALRCAVDLHPEPEGPTAVGFVLFDDERYGLARYDANGALVQSQRINGSSRWSRGPRALRMIEGQDELRFFITPSPETPIQLRVHRRSDLALVETATIADVPGMLLVTWLDDDNVLIVDDNDTFIRYDVARRAPVSFGSYADGQVYPGRFVAAYAATPDDVVLSMNGAASSTLYRSRAGPPSIRLPFAPELALGTITGWPDGRWLVTGIDPGEPNQATGLTFYDPAEDRFIPGIWHAARGLASLPVWDGSGRLWIAHPWSNEISRLTPR